MSQPNKVDSGGKRLDMGKRWLLGLAAALVLLMLCVGFNCGVIRVLVEAGPSIWTDKPDYYSEEMVTISGASFSPGPVALTIARPDGEIEQIPDVSADSSGSFTATYQLDGIIGTYIVNAIDSAGQTAQTTFTDGATGVSMGSQVGTLTYGTPGSVTYAITVYGEGESGHFDLTAENLPSGATASFNPSHIDVTDKDQWPATSTLTISTDGTTPVGNYTIKVIESPGSGAKHDAYGTLTIGGCTTYYWYRDSDGDGHGDPNDSVLSCTKPDGYVADNIDNCPNDPNKIVPGQCGCGVADTDTDGDGVADCLDGCPNDPNKTAPGTCGCGVADTDSDGDGVADCTDLCPSNPNKTVPGTCGCGTPDVDSDNDGTLDCLDGCPNDPNKIVPGQCGCGVADTDADNDGTAECTDLCPSDPSKTAPGICGCGTPDTDTDGDGVADCLDGCPNNPNKTAPGTCGCGIADTDSDGDGVADCTDLCPSNPNKTAPGICGCDIADTDSDGDGVADCIDCDDTDPTVYPSASELCDGKDNDCDGNVPDNEADSDTDGYRVCQGDCNNSNADVHPGATEVCNGIDDDCDGNIDEGVKTTYYRDADNDSYGSPNVTTQNCTQPAGYVSDNTDCDDSNPAVHLGATEVCNGIDDDCDGSIDEGCTETYIIRGTITANGAPLAGVLVTAHSPWTGTATTNAAGKYTLTGVPCGETNILITPTLAGYTFSPLTRTVPGPMRASLGDQDFIADSALIGSYRSACCSGLNISSTEGGSVTTPGDGTFPYLPGSVVDLVASPDPGYKFVNWSGDVATIADVYDASTTITMEDWYYITANFEKGQKALGQYELTVSSTAGGSVTTPGVGTFTYDAGTSVSLVAKPDDGYKFVNWTGDGITHPDSATTTLTMGGDYSIKANFAETSTGSGEESSVPTGCFIATAAYGTPTAEQIDVLREFRDVVLLKSTAGSQFVTLYYRLSPPIADFIAGNELLRTLVREFLVDPIVWIVEATGDIWQN